MGAFRDGNPKQALEFARAAENQCRGATECNWSARLLEAEVLLNDDQIAAAAALLNEEPPAGDAFRPLTARRTWLLGDLEFARRRPAAAEDLLKKASQLAGSTGDWEVAQEAGTSLARMAYVVHHDAESAAAAFRDLADRASNRRSAYYEAVALNGAGMVLLKESRFDEALPWFRRTMEAAKHGGGQRLIVAAGQNLAICYSQLGSFPEALRSRSEAIQLLGGTGFAPYRMELVGGMGNTALLQGDARKAMDYYRQALALARTETDSARWYRSLTSAYVTMGDWNSAEKSNQEAVARQHDSDSLPWTEKNAAAIAAGRGEYDKACALYRKTIQDAGGDPLILWESHAALAQLHTRARKYLEANREYTKTIEIIDSNVDQVSSPDYKLTYFSLLIRFYQNYVRALVEQKAYDQALEVADSSRARILQQRLAVSQSWKKASARDYPRIARTSGAVLLFYWIAPVESYLWVVTPDGIRPPITLPAADKIRGWVGQFRGFIEQRLGDPVATPNEAGRQLYDALVAPAARYIPPGSRVILFPDDALNWLNFETLPVYGAGSDAKPHYWIEDLNPLIAPSLSALNTGSPRPRVPDSLLVIGDPVPPDRDFPKLEYAAKEIETIESKFPGARTKVFTGATARPGSYREAGPEQFSLVHFSAHGVANQESPLESAIILSPEGGNYKLYARSILDTPLRADLVTISACRSAGAQSYSGEGLVGFVWAFLLAGARNVIAGLWDVTDSSTPGIMDVLYSEVAQGKTPAEGLRKAKLALIHSRSSYRKPYYWGPFQIYSRGF